MYDNYDIANFICKLYSDVDVYYSYFEHKSSKYIVVDNKNSLIFTNFIDKTNCCKDRFVYKREHVIRLMNIDKIMNNG